MKQIQRLERILNDLDSVAGYFEDRGFNKEQEILDAAADKVEKVKDWLKALQ